MPKFFAFLPRPLSSLHRRLTLAKFAVVFAVVFAVLAIILERAYVHKIASRGRSSASLSRSIWYRDIVHYEPRFSPEDHPYIPPTKGDSRSPCPALNTLANHGYLPRDGHRITCDRFIYALRDGYNLSPELAVFLTYASHGLLGQFTELSLADLSRHGFVEHDCSLGHRDTKGRDEYAPWAAVEGLLAEFLSASSNGQTMDVHDFVKARLNRDRECSKPLDALHAEIARGEMSMVLGIFGGHNGSVPVPWLEEWWLKEKFPEGWRPDHEQTLKQTVKQSMDIKRRMSAHAAGKHGKHGKRWLGW